jgi:protein transport protein SEC24
VLPPLVRVSYARLDSAGAYLLENGQSMYLWIGRDISPQFLNDVFGVSTLDQIDHTLVMEPTLGYPSFVTTLLSLPSKLTLFHLFTYLM